MNHRVKILLLAGIGILALIFAASRLNIQSVSEFQEESREIAGLLEPEAVASAVTEGAVSGAPDESGRPSESMSPSPKRRDKGEKRDRQEKPEKKPGKKAAAPERKTPAPKRTARPKRTSAPVSKTTAAPSKRPSDEISCTIEISCHSLCENRERLDKSKWEYVPESGVILAPTKVRVKKGLDAYRLLAQMCRAGNIALDSEYTPMYGSYYVRGIGHLYEMDAGDKSGWLYTVNGERPDVGASAYLLSEGDSVVWRYTCDELD